MIRLPGWWEQRFLTVELTLSVISSVAVVIWSESYGGRASIHTLLDGNRGAVYGTLAAVSGSLLGFVIAAASIAIGLSGSERLSLLRRSQHYRVLWEVFVSTMRWLGVATVVSLVALLMDRDKTPLDIVMYGTFFAVLLAALRVVRCVWVLENLIRITSGPTTP